MELVQRGNAYLRGKSEALKGLRDALAEEMVVEWPEMKEVVGRVVKGEGGGVEGVAGMKVEGEGVNGVKK